jgi:predicted metalloprotease with PDZ domain
MTQTTSASADTHSTIAPSIQYAVAMPHPETHQFEVSLYLQQWSAPTLDLKFPVWTPGSYLVREYARHLHSFTAETAEGKSLPWRKLGKNHWQVEALSNSDLILHYRIFANELTVRTNHLDSTHGYFNPAALFFRIPGYDHQAIAITIVPPHLNWKVTTPLSPGNAPHTYLAANFDELVDSPFEIGTHAVYDFEVLGKPHQFAIWGQGNYDINKLLTHTQRIIEVEADLFGGLPYDRYLFLLHLASQANGGLEHKFCCSLNYRRFGFREMEAYYRFMTLVAHEFFHLWNVKRIRPKALETFDYDQENYTESLWFSEGTTSFYDRVIPLRAGIYDVKHYLKKLGESITQLQTTPGRTLQPVSESSFDAWIKLYRPDANSRNTQVSYYLKGELVSFVLDLLIRKQHQNQRSLDAVMRQMWHQFGQAEIGFTPVDLKAVFESVAAVDLTDFWQRYIDGVEELPFQAYLAPFGLKLKADPPNPAVPYLGATVKAEQGRAMVKFVEDGSPAAIAGLEAGDELLAMDRFRVDAEQLSDRLQDYVPGSMIELTLFHQDLLKSYSVKLVEPIPVAYTIGMEESPTPEQLALQRGWLGVELD